MANGDLGVELDTDLQQVQSLIAPQVLLEVQTYRNLQTLSTSFNEWKTKMAAQLDALAAQVTANTTVIESAVTLIQSFAQRLSDGIAAAEAGDLSKLNDLKTELATEDAKLAAAVEANTPVATAPPAAPAAGASAP